MLQARRRRRRRTSRGRLSRTSRRRGRNKDRRRGIRVAGSEYRVREKIMHINTHHLMLVFYKDLEWEENTNFCGTFAVAPRTCRASASVCSVPLKKPVTSPLQRRRRRRRRRKEDLLPSDHALSFHATPPSFLLLQSVERSSNRGTKRPPGIIHRCAIVVLAKKKEYQWSST